MKLLSFRFFVIDLEISSTRVNSNNRPTEMDGRVLSKCYTLNRAIAFKFGHFRPWAILYTTSFRFYHLYDSKSAPF